MNWLRFKKIYFGVSLLMIAVACFSLLKWNFNLGLDFTGGTLAEYRSTSEISTEDATSVLADKGISVESIQTSEDGSYLFKFKTVDESGKATLDTALSDSIFKEGYEEIRFETVGPSVGPELVKKTGYAIALAAGLILLWVAYQFKSFIFGISAILAMFHDTFILIGSFALFGHLWGAEVDFLFVTALLTTLSFSVHDTIVVFDRIRELQKKEGYEVGEEIANRALSETMVRSLNNSFTILFMLVALILLGGTTIKWFAAALLVGTVLGTYSSPFVAVPILVTLQNKFKTK